VKVSQKQVAYQKTHNNRIQQTPKSDAADAGRLGCYNSRKLFEISGYNHKSPLKIGVTAHSQDFLLSIFLPRRM